MKIGIDLMGGDFAPMSVIEGCARFLEFYSDVKIVVVGIKSALDKAFSIMGKQVQYLEVKKYIGMCENPLKIDYNNTDNSINFLFHLYLKGEIDVVFSAGNSAVITMAAKKYLLSVNQTIIPGALSLIPTINGRTTSIIDAGVSANRIFKRDHIFQYASLATDFYETFLKVKNPTIGLLNVGEENWKGNSEHKKLFEDLKNSSLNFIGNIESDSLLSYCCDIVLTDGFTGNILLKFIESFTEIMDQVEVKHSKNKEYLDYLNDKFNYKRIGGAFLLGVHGKVVMAHGKSRANAICAAINLCCKYGKDSDLKL